MQCCSRYRTKKSVLSVRFDGQSSSTFAALFADWSVSTYAVRNAATGMEIKECHQLSNVDEDEREMIDSEVGTRTEFLETELSESALSRAISALNAPDWKEETVTLLSAKEAARHMLPSTDFPRDIAPFCVRVGRNGAVLVVVVEDGHAGDNDNTYVQLHHSDTENGRLTVERLGGSDGRFAGNGQFIVSWDGCTSNAPENRRSVYVYKTSDIVQNKPSTGRQLINLFRKEAPEMHAKRLNVPENTVLLEARLLLDQNSSSRRPTQLATASLLMLCQVNWSATAKIYRYESEDGDRLLPTGFRNVIHPRARVAEGAREDTGQSKPVRPVAQPEVDLPVQARPEERNGLLGQGRIPGAGG